jgi:hypothetical protein
LPPPDLPASTRAQAAARCVGKVLQVERAHRALEADMELADRAFGQGEDLDAREAQRL